MNSENSQVVIKTTINRQHIVDSLALFLNATKVVSPSQEIANIQFDNLFGTSVGEFCPIKIYIKGGTS